VISNKVCFAEGLLFRMQPKNSILCTCVYTYTLSSVIYHCRSSAVSVSETEYDDHSTCLSMSAKPVVSSIPVTVHVYLEPRHTEVQAVLSVG
jgi:hypothetical protein